MFGAAKDRIDAMAFPRRGLNDGHHFRFSVTPEDAAEMTDLRAFTRDLVGQMESDLGTGLDRFGIAPLVPISSSRAITSVMDYARGLRTGSRPSLAPGPSMKSAPLSRGRWKRSAGRASTRRSG